MIEVLHESGATVEFDCPATIASVWTNRAIIEGRTYPHVPFLHDVRTIIDAGANCGAASVFFGLHHPEATVHAFEPGGEAGSYLARNLTMLPRAEQHRFGLSDHDGTATLHLDPTNLGQASIKGHGGGDGDGSREAVELKDAGRWARSAGIDRIDILKVDVEGCELEVLGSLRDYLPGVQALYVEYDHRTTRRAIDRMLEPTHELYFAGLLALDQGEVLYLNKELADHPEAVPRLREILTRPPTS